MPIVHPCTVSILMVLFSISSVFFLHFMHEKTWSFSCGIWRGLLKELNNIQSLLMSWILFTSSHNQVCFSLQESKLAFLSFLSQPLRLYGSRFFLFSYNKWEQLYIVIFPPHCLCEVFIIDNTYFQ